MINKEKLEFVESVTFRNVIQDVWQAKNKIAMLMIVLAIAGGGLGFMKSTMLPKTPEGKKVTAFDENLKNYDEMLKKAEANLKTSQEQLQKQQDYVNNSPYMKIDPQKQQWGELSYKIDASERMGDVIQSYHNFVNRAWLAHAIASKFPDEPERYIKEGGMWSGNNGNMWTVTVIRKDEETIKKLLPLMKEAIANYKKDVKFEHGITLVKEVNYVRADTGTLKNQNGHRDTLRRYTNDVVNYNRQLVDIQKQKADFERIYKPKDYNVKKPGKAIASYAGFGAIVGLVLSLVYFFLRQIMSNRVKSVEELLGLNIPVLSVVTAKGMEPMLERTVAELQLLAKKQGAQQIYLGCLTDSSDKLGLVDTYVEALQTEGIRLIVSKDIAHDTEELKAFVTAKHTLALVKLGETSYKDVENFMHLCRKFDVDLWGFVVIG